MSPTTLIDSIEGHDMGIWLVRFLYSLMIGLVTVGLILLMSIIWQAYFNQPPLEVVTLDPPDLGILCPKQKVMIHNFVKINSPVIVFYYVNVMDETASYGFADTQKAWVDNIYPHRTSFKQVLIWTVPELSSGKYQRVFAARNSSANQKILTSSNSFKIGDSCK